MATTQSEPAVPTQVVRGERVVELFNIGWEKFEAIVAMKGDRKSPRLIYADGSLTLVSPSQAHERGGDRLDRFINVVCYELGIAYEATAATLFRRREIDRGIEGDETYYIANESAVRENQEDFDPSIDPPPDLAIEVEITHPARDAVEIWRRLGVPEVWVFRPKRRRLTILVLDANGAYNESETSRSFPFLAATEVSEWVAPTLGEPTIAWERRLRVWIRDEISNRVQGG